ncbi:MAG: hypothetical protein FJ267_00805, partial [Planctomycetes bacterium]|nr:hypothetical protein [Planctomycetota bacterium]
MWWTSPRVQKSGTRSFVQRERLICRPTENKTGQKGEGIPMLLSGLWKLAAMVSVVGVGLVAFLQAKNGFDRKNSSPDDPTTVMAVATDEDSSSSDSPERQDPFAIPPVEDSANETVPSETTPSLDLPDSVEADNTEPLTTPRASRSPSPINETRDPFETGISETNSDDKQPFADDPSSQSPNSSEFLSDETSSTESSAGRSKLGVDFRDDSNSDTPDVAEPGPTLAAPENLKLSDDSPVELPSPDDSIPAVAPDTLPLDSTPFDPIPLDKEDPFDKASREVDETPAPTTIETKPLERKPYIRQTNSERLNPNENSETPSESDPDPFLNSPSPDEAIEQNTTIPSRDLSTDLPDSNQPDLGRPDLERPRSDERSPDSDFGTIPPRQEQKPEPTPRDDSNSELQSDLIGDGTVTDAVPRGIQQPRLTIEKIAPKKAVLGEPLVYSVVVKNVGEIDASKVVVEDRIPKGTELIG